MTLGSASRRSTYTFDVLRASLVGSPPARIFFMHIPKCGGTSVSTAISRKFGYEKGKFGARGILSIDAVATKRAAEAVGMSSEQYREYLLLFGMAHSGVRYISGHVPFSSRGYRKFGETWDLVTLFRDPVSKWFSEYFYNRYKSVDHARVTQELEEFVETPTAAIYGSDYVRYLSSTRGDSTSEGEISAALDNLSCFSVVGVLENLQLFSDDFKKHFGFDIKIGMTNRNPVPAKERDSRISPEVRQKVEQLCLPNQRVYEAVLKRQASHRN